MCRTVRLTTICPRCMNPHTTRKNEYLETVTIQEPEILICSHAFETRQVCASAMTDTYDDGTAQPIPEFDRLGQDFCGSCESRLRLHVNTMPAPLVRRPSTYSDWVPSPLLASTSATQQTAAEPSPSYIIKGGIDFLGFPINDRRDFKPSIWIDVLDGNHIMAVPSRPKGGKKPNFYNGPCKKGRELSKMAKRVRAERREEKSKVAALVKMNADADVDADVNADATSKDSSKGKGMLQGTVATDRTTKWAGKHVRFDEETEKSAKGAKKGIKKDAANRVTKGAPKGVEKKKKGTRASIPRKAKNKSQGPDTGSPSK